MSHASTNNSPSAVQRVLEIMQRLRDEKHGCPWDKQQTFASIAPYTIEEAYEVADAIHSGNMLHIKDEVADLLFQVVFYAQLGQEQDAFDFSTICQHLGDKLERRHPHVFAQPQALDEGALSQQWEHIKQQERSVHENYDNSLLANIPPGLAPLKRAQKIQKKCANVGFDWPDLPPVVDKIHEEIAEALAEINADTPSPTAIEEEIGDLLFAVVNLARHAKVDADTALLKANRKFERRFRQVEHSIHQQGKSMQSATMAEMEAAWQLAKK
jgi:nucleoside triphosphate diphosphatase